MNLMIVTNSNYLKYAYILLFSFFEQHEDEQVDIYLPYEELTDDEISGLSSFVSGYEGKKLIPLYVGDEFKKRVTSRNGISVDTYYRILAIDMLPADMDRILYLDVDMVVKGDLRELYDTDLSGYAFGVCEDIFGKINGFHEANKRRLGIPGEYSYFNAGVMLFNLEYLRAEGAAEKLLDAIYKNYERYEYNDQDVMNELYYDKLLYLPWNRYNLPPAYYFVNRFDYADTVDEDIQVLDFLSYDTLRGITDDELKICENVMDSLYRRAHIIHYMGNTKPWSKTREESAPYNLFDWAYKNALDRFEGAGEPDRKLRVVFFPYKIQMWDSLSSVYQAAIDDPHCEVSVVPIPYRQYDKGADRWNECYEGEAFAKLFQVEDHRKYMGGAAHETVDIGYIHNPFDELNSVTRVVSDFYSYNLKKYVRKLIYVPYYVTGGFMSEAYVQLSSNTYVDVHVAQCENYIRAFESRSAADKVIPLGSPKLDRVIELTRENVSYPPEWGLQKTGKKLVFVNTSINNLLQFGDYALKKLKKIFEAVEGRDDIFIVWRPHPLLKSTISAMRPELSEMYEELLSYFNDNSIGVYDTTDDISRVVAVCDAYVGEESTSVINLFAVVGKPVYIINYEIDYEDAPDERAWLRDVKKDASGSTYALTCAGGLQTLSELKADDDGNCQRLAAQLHSEDGDIVWHSPYSRMESFEDDLYLTPLYAAQPAAFDHESRQVVKLWGEDMPDALMYIGSVIYKDRIYYIPCSMDMMCVMELKKQGVDFIAAPFYAWKSRVRGDSYAVTGYVSCGNMLYMTSIDSNIILGYDMDTGESRMYLVTADDFRFSCVDTDGEYLYLSEALTGSVFRWSEKKGLDRIYQPHGEAGGYTDRNNRAWHSNKILCIGDRLYLSPGFSKAAFTIDINTGESELLEPDFWKNAALKNEIFDPTISHVSCFMGREGEDHLLLQRTYDGMICDIDLKDMSHTEYELYYEKDTFEALMEHDGFEKPFSDRICMRSESVYMPFGVFFDDLSSGKLYDTEKRLSRVGDMSVNTDGTAGQNIHKYAMELVISELGGKIWQK